ncbi:nitroreductase family protein [Geopsychrobacter electrodiphilus]|uniref:nitroreductase family protein n=1 Tax=Geopsychrobacter electrodiphilus TaxID=225196 RepID=UPI00036D811D|nr:nitroreductase family protein [Geopsychrobacter electrodiphilus]
MLNILRQRRSVRDFTNAPIRPDTLETLREAILRAPTSRNNRPWQFIFVEEKALIEQLAVSKAHGTRFMQSAQLALVIVADPAASDVWVEDCAIAGITAQYAAESLGLKSCWGQLRLRAHDESCSAGEYVRKLLKIPAGLEVPIIIGFGYPVETPKGHEFDALPWDKLHHNRFGG